jgi:hypothetical protein
MAFSSWDSVRSDLKNAIADYALSGKFMIRSYQIGDFSREIQSIEEAEKFYQLTYKLEALENRASRGGIRITGGTPT